MESEAMQLPPYMESGKRRRLTNAQKLRLIEIMETHYALLFGHATNERRKRDRKWTQFTEELNALPSGCQKASLEWRSCFNKMRKMVEEKLKLCVQNSRAETDITNWDQRIALICFRDSAVYADVVQSVAGDITVHQSTFSSGAAVQTEICDEQKTRLIELMAENYALLYDPNPRSSRQLSDKWTDITAELNSMSPGGQNETSDWGACFKNIRHTLDRKLRSIRWLFLRDKPIDMYRLSESDLRIIRIWHPHVIHEIKRWEARTPSITASPFSNEQIARLLQIMSEEYEFLYGTDPGAFHRRLEKWRAIAAELNSMPMAGQPLSYREWRNCFTNMRRELDKKLQQMLLEQGQSMASMRMTECDRQILRICFPHQMDDIERWEANTPRMNAIANQGKLRESSQPISSQSVKTEPMETSPSIPIPSGSSAIQVPREIIQRGQTLSRDDPIVRRFLAKKFHFGVTNTEQGDSNTHQKIKSEFPLDPAETVMMPEFHSVDPDEDDEVMAEPLDPLDLGVPEARIAVPQRLANRQTQPSQSPSAAPELKYQPSAIGGPESPEEVEHQVLMQIARRLKLKQTELMRKRKFAALQYKNGMQALKKRQLKLEAIVFGNK